MKYEVRRLTTDGKTWPLGETSDMSGNPFMDQWKNETDTVQVTVHDADGKTISTSVNTDRVSEMAANLRTPAAPERFVYVVHPADGEIVECHSVVWWSELNDWRVSEHVEGGESRCFPLSWAHQTREAAEQANRTRAAPSPADALDEGGDAFPAGTCTDIQPGMSLRDWFAGQVIGHVIYCGFRDSIGAGHAARIGGFDQVEDFHAHNAYLIADAMIRAKRRTEEGR